MVSHGGGSVAKRLSRERQRVVQEPHNLHEGVAYHHDSRLAQLGYIGYINSERVSMR